MKNRAIDKERGNQVTNSAIEEHYDNNCVYLLGSLTVFLLYSLIQLNAY